MEGTVYGIRCYYTELNLYIWGRLCNWRSALSVLPLRIPWLLEVLRVRSPELYFHFSLAFRMFNELLEPVPVIYNN